jgi:hypothetical protein
MGVNPGERMRAVVEEGGIADLRIEPVVRDRDDDPLARKPLAEREIEALAAAAPGAAIEEQDHRGFRLEAIGDVEIEPLARIASIGEIRRDVIARARHRQIEQRYGRRTGRHEKSQHDHDERCGTPAARCASMRHCL